MTGIDLISAEREHQIQKGRTASYDALANNDGQLTVAIQTLSLEEDTLNFIKSAVPKALVCPKDWDENTWERLLSRPYKERMIIVGALCAAELDKLIYLEQNKTNEESTQLS